jgi:hypothetical protein
MMEEIFAAVGFAYICRISALIILIFVSHKAVKSTGRWQERGKIHFCNWLAGYCGGPLSKTKTKITERLTAHLFIPT